MGIKFRFMYRVFNVPISHNVNVDSPYDHESVKLLVTIWGFKFRFRLPIYDISQILSTFSADSAKPLNI